ncbi:MAG: hypothetical protein V5A21_06635, partial [Halapricum sp.]
TGEHSHGRLFRQVVRDLATSDFVRRPGRQEVGSKQHGASGVALVEIGFALVEIGFALSEVG